MDQPHSRGSYSEELHRRMENIVFDRGRFAQEGGGDPDGHFIQLLISASHLRFVGVQDISSSPSLRFSLTLPEAVHNLHQGGILETLLEVLTSWTLQALDEHQRPNQSTQACVNLVEAIPVAPLFVDVRVLRMERFLGFTEVEVKLQRDLSLVAKGGHTKFFSFHPHPSPPFPPPHPHNNLQNKKATSPTTTPAMGVPKQIELETSQIGTPFMTTPHPPKIGSPLQRHSVERPLSSASSSSAGPLPHQFPSKPRSHLQPQLFIDRCGRSPPPPPSHSFHVLVENTEDNPRLRKSIHPSNHFQQSVTARKGISSTSRI
jgi:hypothetical protein